MCEGQRNGKIKSTLSSRSISDFDSVDNIPMLFVERIKYGCVILRKGDTSTSTLLYSISLFDTYLQWCSCHIRPYSLIGYIYVYQGFKLYSLWMQIFIETFQGCLCGIQCYCIICNVSIVQNAPGYKVRDEKEI